MADGCLPTDGWKYSQTHNAILGPFGELLTEDDLVYLQRQMETVSLQNRCRVYELELSRLAQELRLILPDPLINISVNTEVLQQMDAEGHLPLPVWCSRVSEIVRNMSLLLTNLSSGEEGGEGSAVGAVLEGVRELQEGRGGSGLTPGLEQSSAQQGQERRTALEETSSVCRIPHIGMDSAFSHRLETNSYSRVRRERVRREIQQSGVSVRTLRSNFEGQIGGIYPFAGFVSDSPRQGVKGGQGVTAGTVVGGPEVNNQTTNAGCDLNHRLSPKPVPPVIETTSLRKERIVVLFLSHWKKSAYAITVRAARLRQAQEAAGKADTVTSPHPQQKITSMFQFCRQRLAVDKILRSWRGVKSGLRATPTSCPSSCSPSQAPPPRVTYSPEQFLPQVDGVAVTHDTLTLDLFMLGYFHILEQELSAEERKMRHLLCFEVFDHVGSFPWEKVRDFHKAVLQEIQAGRRQWSEGFEDIKARFFGNSNNSVLPGRCHQGGARECHHCPSSSASSLSPDTRPVPKVIVQTATPDESGSGTDFSCFSNEEICKYIDRSFAFWKEKEAELFDFEH